MAKKVIGVYDTETEVIEAVNNLKTAGYTPEDITIVAKNSDETAWIRNETNLGATTSDDWTSRAETHEEDESFWEKVKDFFTGESEAYDDRDGYTSRFTRYGLTDADAARYNSEVESGRIVLLAPEVVGETTTAAATSDFAMDTMDTTDRLDAMGTERNTERKMKLREEELDVDKHEVSAGEVEVRKEVHEETRQIDVPVTREEIYVERKPVNKEDTAGTIGRMEDETIRVPLKEEEIEVRKRPVVKEEVEIGKKKVHETEEVMDTVKREELDVDMGNNRDRSRELDAVYMEDEDVEERLKRRADRNPLLDEEDDRL